MKTIIFCSSIILLVIFTSGCSNGKVLNAPNGKKYYVDVDGCDSYTLNRDTLFCYSSDDENFKKVYKPVTFGYEINTRRSY